MPACPECAGRSVAFDRAVCAGVYADALRKLILSHKFRGDLAARDVLVTALTRTCRLHAMHFTARGGERVITSVPQHPLKTLRRGRDPGRELATAFAAHLDRDYRPLLRKSRWTRPQVALPRTERLRSPRGSFRVRRRVPLPARVVLVDDVLTTASTASACAAALKAAGVREVIVLAVARS